MAVADPQAFLRGLFDAAVAAVSPAICVPPQLPAPPRGRTVVIGAGKAAAAMAAAVEAQPSSEFGEAAINVIRNARFKPLESGLAGCIDRVIFRIRAQPDHGESEAAAH